MRGPQLYFRQLKQRSPREGERERQGEIEREREKRLHSVHSVKSKKPKSFLWVKCWYAIREMNIKPTQWGLKWGVVFFSTVILIQKTAKEIKGRSGTIRYHEMINQKTKQKNNHNTCNVMWETTMFVSAAIITSIWLCSRTHYGVTQGHLAER